MKTVYVYLRNDTSERNLSILYSDRSVRSFLYFYWLIEFRRLTDSENVKFKNVNIGDKPNDELMMMIMTVMMMVIIAYEI